MRTLITPLHEALRADDLASVLASFRPPHDEPSEVPDAKAPVRAALRYLGNRVDLLDSAHAHALRQLRTFRANLLWQNYRGSN